MSKDGRIWLSHSGIESLERCPRCFWFQYKKKIRQPEGIVSRLANRFDGVLKYYFNSFRDTDKLPPMIEGKIKGKLQNPFQEKYFVRINNKYGFWGKLDECLIDEEGKYVPVDFKTSSSDPRGREILPAYKSQVDDYAFLLAKNGFPIAGYGYLIFVHPDQGEELHKGFPMIIHIVKLEGDISRTEDRIQKAINVLETDAPFPSEKCNFCNWYTTLKQELETIGQLPF